jgi:hypothetical protein
MQALIRSTPEKDFPSVGRFREVHEEGAFNSPAWVTRFILDRLVNGAAVSVGPESPEMTVRLRVPDEH